MTDADSKVNGGGRHKQRRLGSDLEPQGQTTKAAASSWLGASIASYKFFVFLAVQFRSIELLGVLGAPVKRTRRAGIEKKVLKRSLGG